jgi:hypothetical protein
LYCEARKPASGMVYVHMLIMYCTILTGFFHRTPDYCEGFILLVGIIKHGNLCAHKDSQEKQSLFSFLGIISFSTKDMESVYRVTSAGRLPSYHVPALSSMTRYLSRFTTHYSFKWSWISNWNRQLGSEAPYRLARIADSYITS